MACVVKVKSETLKTCMTCPLCNKFIKEATTISLCLHTFCRRCIFKKLTIEEVDCCPVCNIDLGAIPVEKLRPDHNLEDVRAKIFPYKRIKVEASDVVTPESLSVNRRKERSLSSLVVSKPKMSMQIGKRSKGASRKVVFHGSGLLDEENLKKEENSCVNRSMSSNLQHSVKDSAVYKRQLKDASSAKPLNKRYDKDTDKDVDIIGGKADLWTPLTCLVEAANSSKLSRGVSQGPFLVNLEQSNNGHNSRIKVTAESVQGDLSMSNNKVKEYGQKKRLQSESNGNGLLPGPVKCKRLRAMNRKGETLPGEVSAISGSRENRRNTTVWLRLLALEDQKGDVSLPQISKCYLRLKDGSVPVSCIQKYLVKKLDLIREAEVEIMCRGEPVLPTLRLQNLIDLWFKTSSTSRRIPASAGTSAKDFVMVLFYCRKVQAI